MEGDRFLIPGTCTLSLLIFVFWKIKIYWVYQKKKKNETAVYFYLFLLGKIDLNSYSMADFAGRNIRFS